MKSMIDQKLEQDFNGTRGYNRNLKVHWAIQGGKKNQFAWSPSHMQMRLLAHEIQPFYGNYTALH